MSTDLLVAAIGRLALSEVRVGPGVAAVAHRHRGHAMLLRAMQ
jgi:hypothetical protein